MEGKGIFNLLILLQRVVKVCVRGRGERIGHLWYKNGFKVAKNRNQRLFLLGGKQKQKQKSANQPMKQRETLLNAMMEVSNIGFKLKWILAYIKSKKKNVFQPIFE